MALATATRESAERVTESELRKAISRRRQGDDWSVILPEVAQLKLDTQGGGIPIFLRIKKDADIAFRIAKDNERVVGTLIKQEINIWDKYNLGRDDIAKKLGMSKEEIFRLSKIDRQSFLEMVTRRQTFSKAVIIRKG